MIFKNIDGKAIATTTTGLKVQAHGSGMLFGTENKEPLTRKDCQVKILTSLELYDINGEPTGDVYHEPKFTVKCLRSNLPTTDVFSQEAIDFYVESIVKLTTPSIILPVDNDNSTELIE